MPRIARPHTQEAIRARQAIEQYLEASGKKAYVLAEEAGIAQPTLSKFMTGRTKSVTEPIRVVLKYAEITVETGIQKSRGQEDNRRLRDALARAWDGSAAHAEALAAVIEAVGPVLLKHVHQNS